MRLVSTEYCRPENGEEAYRLCISESKSRRSLWVKTRAERSLKKQVFESYIWAVSRMRYYKLLQQVMRNEYWFDGIDIMMLSKNWSYYHTLLTLELWVQISMGFHAWRPPPCSLGHQ